jgi:hypothetical protein
VYRYSPPSLSFFGSKGLIPPSETHVTQYEQCVLVKMEGTPLRRILFDRWIPVLQYRCINQAATSAKITTMECRRQVNWRGLYIWCESIIIISGTRTQTLREQFHSYGSHSMCYRRVLAWYTQSDWDPLGPKPV